MNLFFRKYGHGSKHLLILHGLFGMGDNWVTLARKFADFYTVWLPDMRNHGNSPHSHEIDYCIMAEDIAAFMHTHDIDKASLIGHSMGGKTAMMFAVEHPQLVHDMVIVDIGPGATTAFTNHAEILHAIQSTVFTPDSTRHAIEAGLSARIGNQRAVKLLMKNIIRSANGVLQWKLSHEAISANAFRLTEAIHPAGSFTGRVLLVKGELSVYVTDEDVELMYDIFPLLSVITIPEAGHWVHAENPEAFYQACIEFLRP
jgi:pimeloyl-ACP methyl ester carboxylesterase